MIHILLTWLLWVGATFPATAALPQNYLLTTGSVISTVDTGITGLAANTKAFGSGTSSGVDNTDTTFIRTSGLTKNIKVTIDSTAGSTAHNIDWTISRVFFGGQAPSIGMWLHFPVAANVSGCSILITADNYTSYFQVNLTGIQAKRDGWNFFHAHKDDFTVGAGSPSWTSTMTKMRLQCTGTAATIATIYVDQNYSGYYARPHVVFTFDDNEATLFTVGQPILDAKGWKATLFSQGQRIDANGYGTLAQHQSWRAAGHEIYNHTQTHVDLTGVSAQAAADEIDAGYATISALGLVTSGAKHFAYPFGNFNDTVKTLLRDRGYQSARAVGGLTFTPYITAKGYEFDEFQVEAAELNSSVSLAQAKAEVDQAIKYGGTIIFLIHAFVVSSPGASSWQTSDFQALCDYIQVREPQLTVLKYGEWFAGHTTPRRVR